MRLCAGGGWRAAGTGAVDDVPPGPARLLAGLADLVFDLLVTPGGLAGLAVLPHDRPRLVVAEAIAADQGLRHLETGRVPELAAHGDRHFGDVTACPLDDV